MPRFGFVGPSYTSQALNADAQETINWYVEQDESGAGNSPLILYPSPGEKVFVNLNPTPPLPPLNPDPFNGSIVTFNAGVAVDPTRNGIPINTSFAVQVGDIMFLTFFEVLAGNANPIVSVTDDTGGGNVWNQLFPRMVYSAGAYAYQTFWTVAGAPISGAGTFHVNVTWAITQASADANGNFLCIRGISTLDKVASGVVTGTATPAGPSITTTQNACVLSFINASTGHVTIPPPFFIQAGGGISPLGAIAVYFNGATFIAAAGLYAPTWTDAAGPLDAAIANVSFI